MSKTTINRNRRKSGRADLWIILAIAVVLIAAVVIVLLRLLDQSEKHVETVKDMKVDYADSRWNPESKYCELSIERDVNANPDRRDAVFEQLNLSENGVKQIARLKKLVNLNLTGSTLSDDWLRHLEKLPLEKLNLTATDITNKGLESVARITSLKELVLDELDGINDQSILILKPLKKLKRLTFNGAHVTADGIKNLTGFKMLKYFHSSGSNANEDFFQELGELKEVKELKLERSSISVAGISHLSKMKNLRTLYIDGSGIDDIRAAAIAQSCGNLEAIALANNPLSDRGLAELEKIKNLMIVNVNDCKNITDKGIEHFAQARPGRHVSHESGKEKFNKSMSSIEP